jgi:hypothetical protein
MAQQTINIGSAPNDGAGDPLRTAFQKCNDNFTELYSAPSGGTGTVTSVGVATANGVSATITNPTTTPSMTFSLGNIIPATVNGIVLSGSSNPALAVAGTSSISGSHSGTSSGTNTGDIVLAGAPDYITISGQTITRGLVDLSTDITGNLSYSRLNNLQSNRILGRVSGGTGEVEPLTMTNVLDIVNSAQGVVLYRGAVTWAGLLPGTSGYFLKTQGAGANPTWAKVDASPKNLWIPAGTFKSRITGGCSAGTSESSTHKVNLYELLFDQSTDQFAQATVVMPSNWDGGTITAKFYWTAASGTGDVVWVIQGRAFADGNAIDQAFGAQQSVTDTLTVNNQVQISSATSAITLAGTPSAGNLVVFQMWRNGDDAGDTLNGSAYLIGVDITYTAS